MCRALQNSTVHFVSVILLFSWTNLDVPSHGGCISDNISGILQEFSTKI